MALLCGGPALGEFGVAVLSAPHIAGLAILSMCNMHTILDEKSKKVQTTFCIFLLDILTLWYHASIRLVQAGWQTGWQNNKFIIMG